MRPSSEPFETPPNRRKLLNYEAEETTEQECGV